MNNRDFVLKHAAHIRNGEACPSRGGRAVASHIYCEGDHLESYGSHYPLLYRIESQSGAPLLVVNARGYSNSTAKHINHATMAAYRLGEFVRVFDSGVIPNARGVRDHLVDYRAKLGARYDALARKNTKKAAMMLEDIQRVEADIKKIYYHN